MVTSISVVDLWKDFDGLSVLRGVDLHIPSGERHAIIGPNGSGKTTLIHTISGNYKPSRGSIKLGDADVGGLSPFRLARRSLARSFQIISVFPDYTAFENLRIAVLSRRGIRFDMWRSADLLDSVTEEAEAMLSRVGLSEYRDVVAAELPYGRQRTLDLALTFALQSGTVILDEPCAGIATSDIPRVTELIRDMSARRTLIMVEHDMDVVFVLADRISVLAEGRILAQGTPDQIRNDPEVKSAYLGFRENEYA